jgi:hypothetical protein
VLVEVDGDGLWHHGYLKHDDHVSVMVENLIYNPQFCSKSKASMQHIC